MELWLDYGSAWVSVALAILLSVVFLLRKAGRIANPLGHRLARLNKKLRQPHKTLGALLLVTGLVHGYYSSQSVLSLNLGTAAWVLSLLLAGNWLARRLFRGRPGWMHYHRLLTAAFIAVSVLHVLDAGIEGPELLLERVRLIASGQTDSGGNSTGQQTDNTAGDDKSNTGIQQSGDAVDTLNRQLQGVRVKDGTFTGEASGYGSGLTVRVTIKNNAITSIEITSHNERNSNIYGRAMEAVPQAIIESQSLDVDTVTGATFTSTGIINAVNDALSQALIEGTLPAKLQLPQGRRH